MIEPSKPYVWIHQTIVKSRMALLVLEEGLDPATEAEKDGQPHQAFDEEEHKSTKA